MGMLSDSSPVSFADPLPEAVDVVVIGAGIIGISTAWFLARNGVSVLVCEKGRVAGEQSSRNWGWVRQQGRDYAELPIMRESIGIWDTLATETGEDHGFARQGTLYLAKNEKDLAGYEQWLDEVARPYQLDSRMISAAEADALVDAGPGQWKGALYTQSDGRAEPFVAVPALARALQRAGAAVVENCAVRSIETSAGKTSMVVTEKGAVKTNAVVCAAGAWASLFLGNLGLNFPQLTVKSCVARTAEAPDIYAGNASCGDISFRRRMDGGYSIAVGGYEEHFVSRDSFRYFFRFLPAMRAQRPDMRLHFNQGMWGRLTMKHRWRSDEVTPFEEARVLNPTPTPETVNRMRQQIAERLPKLAEVPLAETWAGMIDTTPDIVPVMDEAPGMKGVFIAAGFSGHGFGIGPGAGRVMADLVQGNPPGHDLERFRFSRFSDGSPLVLGPTL